MSFLVAVLPGLSIHVEPSSPPRSTTMNTPNLISTFLFGSTDPKHYSMTDGIVREDKRTDLGDAIKLAENDPIWALRGKAIQSYAILEQALCSALAELTNMERDNAATIFYRINNADARTRILEKLIRKKHENRFNLFWNSYFKELRPINIRRNEIVHWLSAQNVALNTHGMMIVGVTLIHPGSLGQKADAPLQLTSNDLIDFAIKCDIFARLCNMFLGVTSDRLTGDAATPWLDIFQQPLVYPPPADHPIFRTGPTPDTPPQSSEASP